jgi:dihydroorotate dehydrogenase
MFDDLLARVMDARARMSRQAGTTPVLIKIAPDLTLNEPTTWSAARAGTASMA